MSKIVLCLLIQFWGFASTNRQFDKTIKLVTFDSVESPEHLSDKLEGFNFKRVYSFGSKSIAAITSESSTEEIINQLKGDNTNVVSVESNIVFQTGQVEDTCYQHTYDSPIAWHLNRINQIEKLDFVDGPFQYKYSNHDNGAGIIVYIVDTGIYIDHTEFEEGRATFGYVATEILDFDGTEYDLNGHGTHVSGLVAGVLYGVAKDTQVVSVKCLDKDGYGTLTEILEGLEYIYNQTVNMAGQMKAVINLSLAAKGNSVALETAVQQLYERDVVMVSAAGNNYDGSCYYIPGKYDQVINVGATTENDELADFTNWGSCLNILAPGTNIQSAGINNDTDSAIFTGTSFAAPLVSGVVARYLSYPGDKRFANPQEVLDAIIGDATKYKIDVGNPTTPNILLFTNCTALTEITSTIIDTQTTSYNSSGPRICSSFLLVWIFTITGLVVKM